VAAQLAEGHTWQGRISLTLDDGSRRHNQGTVSPLRDERGDPTYFVAILRDITYEVDLENRFLQMQKMECLFRLAAGIAHDFNNLLTTIIGLAEDLASRSDLPDSARRDVKHVLQAARSGARLARQLVATSRPEAAQPRPVSLDEIARNMSGLLQRTLGSHIHLRHEFTAGDATVVADVGQIEQVIMNLAVNARDAMPQGGELLIRTERLHIEPGDLRSRLGIQPGNYVVLIVRDTGIGMSPEVRERAFEPFFTTKQESGTGLGLATVYGIVRRHGGYVELDSTPGAGTEVRVYLPCAPGAQPADDAAIRAAAPLPPDSLLDAP